MTIKVNVTPTECQGFHVKTAGLFVVDAADMKVNCGIEATGDVVAGSVSLQDHKHGGIKGGSDETSEPI